MNFLKVLKSIVSELDDAHIRYALIGGFAMAMRGVQRATMDLDFILLMDDLNRADTILRRYGYQLAFKNDNVSHYKSSDSDWGRIDILHAFREPTRDMLNRADRLTVQDSLDLPVVQIEDIIGLKLQAKRNDFRREEQDSSDIRRLLQSAAENRKKLNWDLIENYRVVLGLSKNEIFDMKAIYEKYSN